MDWVCYRVTGSWLYTCTYGRAIYWILLSFFIFVTNWNLNWTISLHDSCIKYYGIWGESLYKEQFLIRLHSESNNNINIKIRTFELTTDIDLVQVELRTDTDLIPARFLLEFYPFLGFYTFYVIIVIFYFIYLFIYLFIYSFIFLFIYFDSVLANTQVICALFAWENCI